MNGATLTQSGLSEEKKKKTFKFA